MILASGVKKCRFCDYEVPAGFWGAARPRTESGATPLPSKPPGAGSSSHIGPLPPRTSSRVSPLPFPPDGPDVASSLGAGPAKGSGLAKLSPPTNLKQGSVLTPLPGTKQAQSPGTPPGKAPGDSVASRALEQELDALTRGSEAPPKKRTETSKSAIQTRADGTVQVEAFDTRKAGYALAFVGVLLVSAIIYFMATSPAASTPARECQDSCQTQFEKAEKAGTTQLEHIDFMSGCVQECLRPKPEPGAGRNPKP